MNKQAEWDAWFLKALPQVSNGEECDQPPFRLGSHHDPSIRQAPTGADVLTLREAGDSLRVSGKTVQRLGREGKLEVMRVGTGTRKPRYRVTASSLEEYKLLARVGVPDQKRATTRRPAAMSGVPARF